MWKVASTERVVAFEGSSVDVADVANGEGDPALACDLSVAQIRTLVHYVQYTYFPPCCAAATMGSGIDKLFVEESRGDPTYIIMHHVEAYRRFK